MKVENRLENRFSGCVGNRVSHCKGLEAGIGIEPIFTDLQSGSESRDSFNVFHAVSRTYGFENIAGQSENVSRTLKTAPPAWLPLAIIAGALVWAAIIVGVL